MNANKQDLRLVEWSTHQGGGKGYFHRYYEKNQILYALIESHNGQLNGLDLSYNSLKFLDRKSQTS